MDKKRLAQLGLALFVGLIFISSYISLVNYNSQQQTTVTTAVQTYYAQGFANATITGYGGPMYFLIMSKNSTSRSIAANIITSNLTVLEDNNSILDFYSTGENISVEPENMTAYQVYQFISQKTNGTVANGTASYAIASAELPPIVNFTVGTQGARIPITGSYRNQSITLPIKYKIGSSIRVKISTLITSNGTISGQMNLVVI